MKQILIAVTIAMMIFGILFANEKIKNKELKEDSQSKNISLMACRDLLQYEMSLDKIDFKTYVAECRKINGTLFYSDDAIKGMGCLLE